MGFIKPAEMTKISITGAKKDLDTVIDELYDLKLLDIDDYDGELDTGVPSSEADKLSELLVDLRSTLSKLPEVEGEEKDLTIDQVQRNLPNIDAQIEESREEMDKLEREIEDLEDKKTFFDMLKGSGVSYRELKGSDTLSVFIGDIDREMFESEAPNQNYEIAEGKEASVVFYHNKYSDEFEKVLNSSYSRSYELPDIGMEGNVKDLAKEIKSRKKEKEAKKEEYRAGLKETAREWSKGLENIEQFLTKKVEKAEAPLDFATTENAFIAYGWVPTEEFDRLETRIRDATEDRVHIQEEEGEEPPVKHQNNKVVQPFEALTDLVSVPRYNEIDPSFMLLLTFPLFFGMMIGDAGYGISTAVVFLAGMKFFPAAADIFKALLWTSAATLIFGLIYGEMFGFQIYESPFYRADWWTEIFYITLGIGVVHVNLGLLIGAYNEYVHHGVLEAIFAKISWMFLQVAAVAAYFTASTYGTVPAVAVFMGITVPTVLMLYKGEGVEGLVEIPSLASNILSYLRLFGVCMAAYTLAGTANAIAGPAFASGSLLGMAVGALILVFAHIILTFIKIMEGFLQGIRLHYVEMFGWFYEGGGKKYSPFGAD